MAVESTKNKFNILIIEDDERTFSILKEALKDNKYMLHRVSTGQEALRMIKRGYFIVVITELRVKDISGVELIRRLRKIDQRVSIIPLTVYSFADSAVEAMKEGAYGYLLKPLNIEEVRLVLRRAIENAFLLIQAGQRKYYQDISIIDGLTGVYNHRHFHEMLDWHVAHLRRFPQSFSLIIIDIDDFKKYNDTHGHVDGDKVLHDAAQLFVNTTRDSDMVFRYGGEEFAVLLAQTDQKSAIRAGERLLETVRRQIPVTISIGLATFPLNAQAKNDLVTHADKALYRAKASGKNRICVFDGRLDK